MRHKVNQSVEIMLDGRRCLLEKGDEITVHGGPDLSSAPTSAPATIDDYINQMADHVPVAQEGTFKKDNETNVDEVREASQQTMLLDEINKIYKEDQIQPENTDNIGTILNESYDISEKLNKILNSEDHETQVDEHINESNLELESKVIEEAAVHRKYLEIKDGDECTYYSPASANDNYVLYFINRLFESKKFNNSEYESKIVNKIPAGCKKKSLETFLKTLIPIPENKDAE
jgi:hypothetical protein